MGQEKLRTTRVGCVSVQSQAVVTAAGFAPSVPERDAETSAERDGQLFIVLSALTDGEGYRRCDTSKAIEAFERWRKLHKRWDPYTAGRARTLWRET